MGIFDALRDSVGGSFAVRVVDPERCVRNFVPANVNSYSLAGRSAREQLTAELLCAFAAAVNALSATHRLSQLPSQAASIRKVILEGSGGVAAWEERFGLSLTSLAIENIEYADESRELVNRYTERRMDVLAYEGVSRSAASIAAQQLVAQGVRDNGFGDAGGMLFGMNLAADMNPVDASYTRAHRTGGETMPGPDEAAKPQATFTEQMAALEKLKALADAGILSPDEFEAKKRQILGL